MLELNITKNTNENLVGNGFTVNGKYYARAEVKKTYDMKDLAKHMHQHNAAFSAGLIVGVLTDMVTCIKELALEGNVVKIADLGLFKASVEANALNLSPGARISAGKGAQRLDSELTADITKQQFAVKAVKLIMQATGETTKDDMTDEAELTFTKAAKETIKSLTGNESGTSSNPSQGGENQGGGGTGGGDNNGGGGGGGNGGSDGDDI